MALQLFPLDPVNPNSLSEITPLNWHRYPPVALATTPINVATVTYIGGVANAGAGADNNGETGTIATTDAAFYPTATFAQKATLTNNTIAPDVGKSYALDGTKRGSIEPFDPYPAAAQTTVTPPAFLPSNQL